MTKWIKRPNWQAGGYCMSVNDLGYTYAHFAPDPRKHAPNGWIAADACPHRQVYASLANSGLFTDIPWKEVGRDTRAGEAMDR